MAGAGAQVQKLQGDLAALSQRLAKADGRVQAAEAAAAGQAAAAEEVQKSLKASQEAASKLKAEVSRPAARNPQKSEALGQHTARQRVQALCLLSCCDEKWQRSITSVASSQACTDSGRSCSAAAHPAAVQVWF